MRKPRNYFSDSPTTHFEIALFGPDGSGKTTLSLLFVNYIRKTKKVKTRLFWMRGPHTLALVIAVFFSKFKSMKGTDIPQIGIKLVNRRMWCIVESVSLIPIVIKYMIIRTLYKRHVIVSERSMIDSVAWLLTNYNRSSVCRIIANYLITLSIKSYDKLVYVTADIRTLLKRRKYENIPKQFLLKQISIYNVLYRILFITKNACKIDTTNSTINKSFKYLARCLRDLVGDQM